MDYELCSAQLRDMTEQRECSRSQAERLMAELTNRECTLKAREVKHLTLITKCSNNFFPVNTIAGAFFEQERVTNTLLCRRMEINVDWSFKIEHDVRFSDVQEKYYVYISRMSYA